MKKRSAKTLFAKQVQEVVSFIQPGLDSCYVEKGGESAVAICCSEKGLGWAGLALACSLGWLAESEASESGLGLGLHPMHF